MEKVGVVGFGVMGTGIVEVVASKGYTVIVRDISDTVLQKGMEKVRNSLNRIVAKGDISAESMEEIISRISVTTSLESLADCDIVIEAASENLEVKLTLFEQLDRLVKSNAIFASNTSSIPIGRLAGAVERKDRFLGLHFFNPVPVMKLVEVIKTLLVSDEVLNKAIAFVEKLGKKAIVCKDVAGFVVNRLLVPYLLDAVRAYESGLASIEDIDNAMKLGCGYPMGPFTLLDFVGLDTVLSVAEIMFEEFKDPRYAPPPLLRQLVYAGRLGRKSGRGFYEYEK